MLTVLEKVNILQKVPLFHEVPTESLARLAALAQEVRYEAGSLLYRENDAAESMFTLMEGEVVLLRNGQETEKLAPPSEVGALAMLADQPQPDSARATQPTLALQLTSRSSTTPWPRTSTSPAASCARWPGRRPLPPNVEGVGEREQETRTPESAGDACRQTCGDRTRLL